MQPRDEKWTDAAFSFPDCPELRQNHGDVAWVKVIAKMLMTVLKPFALAAGLAFAALPAAATTVSLTYNGGTANGQARITDAPSGVPAGSLPWTVGAFGFKMTDSTGNLGDSAGKFVAWCLDISHWLGTSGAHSYETTTTPFSNSYGLDPAQMGRVQAVFDANYAAVTAVVTNATQAAFQIALWNALYDTDWTVNASVLTGTFDVSVSTTTADAQALANDYLQAASMDNSATRVWNLTYLESKGNPTKQNLVTATPVPLPAAGLMLLGALGGLGLMRRRRRMV